MHFDIEQISIEEKFGKITFHILYLFTGASPKKTSISELQMLLTLWPEFDFVMAIKIAVNSEVKHWQPPNKAYSIKDVDIFTVYHQ